MSPSARGLILFAHGARDPRWARPFEAVARRTRELQPGRPVTLAFLELMTPSLREAALAMIDDGCMRIDVLPLFLGTGGHVRNDLPKLVGEIEASRPGARLTLHAAAGETDVVIDAMARLAALTLDDLGSDGALR
jgi:sirohydrochlorin cobaltochelatase